MKRLEEGDFENAGKGADVASLISSLDGLMTTAARLLVSHGVVYSIDPKLVYTGGVEGLLYRATYCVQGFEALEGQRDSAGDVGADGRVPEGSESAGAESNGSPNQE